MILRDLTTLTIIIGTGEMLSPNNPDLTVNRKPGNWKTPQRSLPWRNRIEEFYKPPEIIGTKPIHPLHQIETKKHSIL